MNTSEAAKQIESRATVHCDIMTRENEGMTVADASTYVMPIVSLARSIVFAKRKDAYVGLLNAAGLVLASVIKTHVGDRAKTPEGALAKRDVLSLLALGRAMARQVLNGKSTIDILDLTENLIEGNAKHRELLSEVERGILITAYLTVAAERVPT